MFRNLSIARKMALASIPVLIALGAAAGKVVWDEFGRVSANRQTAQMADAMSETVTALEAIDEETKLALARVYDRTIDLTDTRTVTDRALLALQESVDRTGDPWVETAMNAVKTTQKAIRETVDAGAGAAIIFAGYSDVEDNLLALSENIAARVSSAAFATELKAIEKVALARTYGTRQARMIADLVFEDPGAINPQRQDIVNDNTRGQIGDLNNGIRDAIVYARVSSGQSVVGEIDEALELGQYDLAEAEIETLVTARTFSTRTVSEWDALLDARQDALAALAKNLSERVSNRASRDASTRQLQAIVVVGMALGVALAASFITLSMSRSIVRRIQSVAERAMSVTEHHLPALVEAISRPTDDASLPAVTAIRDSGGDEVGELARSFNALQSTLDDVARRQLSVLRKGVADIFVTLARRNRSLIDRQLSVIDELERGEENPEKLGEYYRLDHLATRMRRNAESLLVLAGSESQRKWRKSTPVDDVIRAAIGEVEDYQRVDVLALEPLHVVGSAVSDLAHLLSEILDNATSFSPPNTRVRIAGHFDNAGYLLSVSDRGVGLGDKRLMELNEMLINPPVIGLALDSTLGLFVVARLAQRHGIMVRLVHGSPGTTAQIILPPDLFQAASDAPRALSPPGQPMGSREPMLARPEEPAASVGGLPSLANGGARTVEPSIPTIGLAASAPTVTPVAPVFPTAPPAASTPAASTGVVPGISARPSIGGRLRAASEGAPSLPRRSPGVNFTEVSDDEHSVARGRPAARTRSDLEAFRSGMSRVSQRPGAASPQRPSDSASGTLSSGGSTSGGATPGVPGTVASTPSSSAGLFGLRPPGPSAGGLFQRSTMPPRPGATGPAAPPSGGEPVDMNKDLPTRTPGGALGDDLVEDQDRLTTEKKAPSETRIALSAFQGAKERHEREED